MLAKSGPNKSQIHAHVMSGKSGGILALAPQNITNLTTLINPSNSSFLTTFSVELHIESVVIDA
jgi:hypothetical protein